MLGVRVADGRCLRDRQFAAPGKSSRGWSVVVAPLHGRCDEDTRESFFWTERVLPLRKDHSVGIVESGCGSPWDLFAPLRKQGEGGA